MEEDKNKPDPQQNLDPQQNDEEIELDEWYVTQQEFEEELEADFEDDEELEYEPVVHRKWVKNTVVLLFVAALFVNIVAFWPRIYNMETLPFLFKSRQLSLIEEIQDYKEAVVLISSDKNKGTGFHISEGLIVTNYHVIEDNLYSLVTFPGNDRVYEAELAGSAADLDIALLQIDLGDQELPFISIEQERQWEEGSHIYVIGNPLYFTQIVTEGEILGLAEIAGRGKPAMVIDAPIFPGNSGSPVINEQGNVIAVVYATTEIIHEGEPVQAGLAVPVADMQHLLGQPQ